MMIARKVLSRNHIDLRRSTIFKSQFSKNISSQDSSLLHKAVKSGEINAVNQILQGNDVSRIINSLDNKRWTPLMLAAQLGNQSMIEVLLERGSDPDMRNMTGLTALDLAFFWRRKEAVNMLSKVSKKTINSDPCSNGDQLLQRNPLMRSSDEKQMSREKSVFIALHKGRPVVKTEQDGSCKFLRLKYQQVQQLTGEGTIFLGTDIDGSPWFCIDVSDLPEEELEQTFENLEILKSYALLSLDDQEHGLYAQAQPIVDWHKRNRYCPSCGGKTKITENGYKLVCQNDVCLSNKGINNTSYPRVDPSVICTVISEDRTHCFLARKKSFPPRMFSCLAGFVEPGETIEDACAREVHEETGLAVTQVKYLYSQFWPYPSSLMLGCSSKITGPTSQTMKLDTQELEQGRWFSRSEAIAMITHQHSDKLFVPPSKALAHHLIKAWIIQTAFI